jgi:NAD(P)H dehydrogenase (quinone)
VDVGRFAAELIQQDWTGRRVVELEAEHRVTPNEVAATLAKVLGRPVKAQVVARATWASLFKSQGMKYPQPRIRMLEGFNEGWIEFEGDRADIIKGRTALETILRELVSQGA